MSGESDSGRYSYTKDFTALNAAGFYPGYIDQGCGKIPINTDDWWNADKGDTATDNR